MLAQENPVLRPFAYINGRYFYQNTAGKYLVLERPFGSYIPVKVQTLPKRIGKTGRDKVKKFRKGK